MRTEGTLENWNDDHGFGFVVTDQTRSKIFAHISAFPPTGRRPRSGERLSFRIETSEHGKKRATSVIYLSPPSLKPPIATGRVAPSAPISARATRNRSIEPHSIEARHHDMRPTQARQIDARSTRVSQPHRHAASRYSHRDTHERGFSGTGLAILAVAALVAYSLFRLGADDARVTRPEPAAYSIGANPLPASFGTATSIPAQTTYRCDGRTQCPQMRSCAEARYFLSNCPGVVMDGDLDGTPCEDQWCP